jgi:hypothetical protein
VGVCFEAVSLASVDSRTQTETTPTAAESGCFALKSEVHVQAKNPYSCQEHGKQAVLSSNSFGQLGVHFFSAAIFS